MMDALQTYRPNSGAFLADFIQSSPQFCDGTYFTPDEVTAFLKSIGELKP